MKPFKRLSLFIFTVVILLAACRRQMSAPTAVPSIEVSQSETTQPEATQSEPVQENNPTGDSIPCTPAQGETVTIATAKLIIEYNATDDDIGVHGAFDDHGYSVLCVYDPNGIQVLVLEPQAQLKDLTVAGIFFESREPPAKEFSFTDLKAKFPEGQYEVRGVTFEGKLLTGFATFSHAVPAPPIVLSPLLAEEETADEAMVSTTDLVVEWQDVTETVEGGPVTITGYEVIITKVEHEDPHGFSRPIFDVHVPADRNTLAVPVEFLEPDTVYELEILALEETGNQTITVGFFKTEASENTAAGETAEIDLPVAPESERVDLAEPSFSDPTNITNPLFPISTLHRVILLGSVDGLPFRVETTLLPGVKTIEWNGRQIETLESQYVAHLDGRIHEVALDWYAQADDGAVWYLGEDVFNYEDGIVADTEGTWLAGRDGPVAMIMPANPQIGDVYRPENIPGFVFEEVTVRSIGQTMHGPQGLVAEAIVVEELHMDGTYEDKIFAPGYGEFLTGVGGDLEAVALAVPTNALNQPLPVALETLLSGANDIYEAAQAEEWERGTAVLDTMLAAWDEYQASDVPRMLEAQMSVALVELVAAVDAHQSEEARQAAINAAHAALDLQLQYRPVAEVDLARFGLWAQQVFIDAATDNPGAVTGDVATLEWLWNQFGHTLESSTASGIDTLLGELRVAADDEDLAAASEIAGQLLDALP